MKTRHLFIFAALVAAIATALALPTARTGAVANLGVGDETSSNGHEATTAAAGSASHAATAQQRARVISLTMLSATTDTPAGGQPRLISSSTLHRLSDGTFSRQTSHYDEDGSARETEHLVGGAGRGIFHVDERRRLLILAAPLPDGVAPLTEEALRQSKGFAGEGSALGHRTIILRHPAGPDEDSYVERHFAPELQCVLKEINASARGLRVTEATQVMLGEPERSTFAPLFAYRVDASGFEEKLKKVERTEGSSETARELRKHLTRFEHGRQ